MVLRNALLASAAILAAGSAMAADLPSRSAPPPYYAAPIFSWTGFYMGLNAGAGWNNGTGGWSYAGFTPAPVVYGNVSGNSKTGFTGGVQAGYNMQFGSFVAGVEGDLNYIDRGNGNAAVAPGIANANGSTYYTISRGDPNKWFGTLRGRVGYAFDRALIYATGGIAFGGGSSDSSIAQTVVSANGLTTTRFASNGGNGSSVGWTLGAGVEYAFSNAWSAKLEYLHVDLGSHNRAFYSPNSNTQYITVGDNNRFDLVRGA